VIQCDYPILHSHHTHPHPELKNQKTSLDRKNPSHPQTHHHHQAFYTTAAAALTTVFLLSSLFFFSAHSLLFNLPSSAASLLAFLAASSFSFLSFSSFSFSSFARPKTCLPFEAEAAEAEAEGAILCRFWNEVVARGGRVVVEAEGWKEDRRFCVVLGSRTLLARFKAEVEGSEEGKRARLAVVCLTSAGLEIFGAGLALNAPLSFSLFSSSSFCLASLASFCCFIFAANTSLDSWNVAFVTGLVDFCTAGGT
jgi:hypothetical protein